MIAQPTATVIEFKAPVVAKLENGYTRIANELAEALAGSSFSSSQLRVVLAVARLTYGYRKRTAQISTKKIAEACNMKLFLTQHAVADLIAAQVLFREGGQRGEIGINNHIDQWRFAPDPEAASVRKSANSEDSECAEISKLSLQKSANSCAEISKLAPPAPYIWKENLKEEAERKAAGGGDMDFSAFPYEQISILWDAHLKPLGYGFRLWTPPRMQRVDTLYQFMISQPPSLRTVNNPDDFLVVWKTAVNYWGNGGLQWLLNSSKARFSFDWILDPENGYDRFIQAIGGGYAEGNTHG